jgi:acetyl-CoA acetyltransferase
MKAYVIASSMVRFGKYPDRSVASLGRESIQCVLHDAGVRPDEVQAVYAGRSFGGALDGQVSVPAQAALRGTGIQDVPVFNFDNACAAAPTAMHVAVQAIRAGQYDLVLVVGMDKLFARDRRQSMRALFGAMDVEEMSWMRKTIDDDGPAGSVFMDHYYAKVARSYLSETGASIHDYARVAVKNRANAVRNPYAQYRTPLTEDEVLSSPVVAEPLRVLMCSPLTDGAAAMLLCSERLRARINGPLVEVAASVVRSGKPERGDAEPLVSRAARQAYSEAAIGPEDIDLLEVHDASAVAELIAIEEICLLDRGKGLDMLRSGATAAGGSMPVNLSGGLLSRGHPGAATGASQLTEIVWQLQHRAEGRQLDRPRIGVAHSAGGLMGDEPAAVAISIFRSA